MLLAERGAAVVVNDIGVSVHGTGESPAPADEVAAEIRASGGSAIADHHSVATASGGEAIVEAAVSEFGRIDIVVNNAGILRDRTLMNMEWDELGSVLDVHLKGAFYVTAPAFRHMAEQQYGRVVLTTSASGLFGNFGQSSYGAAKAGLVGVLNVLRLEGAGGGILVNAIAPIAATRMTIDLLGEMVDRFDPASVAPAVAFLCSESCELSGEVWSVVGGSVSRVFIGLCDGYFKHPDHDGPLTVEDIATHVADIRDEDGYIVPISSQDEFAKLGPLLLG